MIGTGEKGSGTATTPKSPTIRLANTPIPISLVRDGVFILSIACKMVVIGQLLR